MLHAISALVTSSGVPVSTVTGPVADVWSSLSAWTAHLNWIDYALVLGLVAGLFVGIGVGFYRQVAIFFALTVGLIAAARLAEPIAKADIFQPVEEVLGAGGASVAAFAFVLWAALVLGLLACLVFHSFFSRTLRVFDGVLGGAMGVAISSMLFGLLLLGIFHSNATQLNEPIRTSQIGSRLAEGARYVSRIFPDDIQDRFDQALGPAPKDG